MYAPHQTPEPVEKIKAKWTVQNTEKTQAAVNDLHDARRTLIRVVGHNNATVDAMRRAIQRFKAMDPQVVLPSWDYE